MRIFVFVFLEIVCLILTRHVYFINVMLSSFFFFSLSPRQTYKFTYSKNAEKSQVFPPQHQQHKRQRKYTNSSEQNIGSKLASNSYSSVNAKQKFIVLQNQKQQNKLCVSFILYSLFFVFAYWQGLSALFRIFFLLRILSLVKRLLPTRNSTANLKVQSTLECFQTDNLCTANSNTTRVTIKITIKMLCYFFDCGSRFFFFSFFIMFVC